MSIQPFPASAADETISHRYGQVRFIARSHSWKWVYTLKSNGQMRPQTLNSGNEFSIHTGFFETDTVSGLFTYILIAEWDQINGFLVSSLKISQIKEVKSNTLLYYYKLTLMAGKNPYSTLETIVLMNFFNFSTSKSSPVLSNIERCLTALYTFCPAFCEIHN